MSYPSLHNGSTPASALLNQAHFPSFTVPVSSRTIPYQPPNFPSSSTSIITPPHPFKAPAHKHAHHLHSIPPREKSTRTLIIDHMLWVHGRTRFTQARAELGMTDRTGGPSSLNYRLRERPESYDEDDEISSDGENVEILKAREGGPGHPHNDDEDNRRQKQDLTLARSLRLRAIGLEKVVTSMLDQPPPVHPILDDDPTTPPTSPIRPESSLQSPKSSQRLMSHPHTLPNGVRLRLALGTVINDLFARQAPPPQYRHHHHPPPIIVSNGSDQASSNGLTPGNSPAVRKASPVSASESSISSAPGTIGSLPPSVVLLSQVSAAALRQTSPLSRGEFRAPVSPMQAPNMVRPRNRRTQFMPNSRVYSMYMKGADPSTANSPPGLRCSRHLHTACEICVEAKQPTKAPGGSGRARAPQTATGTRSFGDWAGGSGDFGKSMGGSGGGIAGWQDGPGVGSGLSQPGVEGSVLRRKSKWFMVDADGEQSGAGNTRLSELIPRFLRLSALVAMELGEELGDDEYDSDWQRERSTTEMSAPSPTSPRSSNFSRRSQIFEAAPLRPSREWYMLFAGLLVRATLEGYLTGGWWGLEAVECLLSVGLGISDDGFGQGDLLDDVDSAFAWFEPDELPSLREAARIMFPALRTVRNGMLIQREGPEAEFEAEMDERLRRFYTIPPLTPDLSTHMEDLAWHYPAEPVERAALRFCEAIAKWRGKPELETYKKKQPKDAATSGGSNMTIETLVHSNPTSPSMAGFSAQASRSQKPAIEKYFIIPPSSTGRSKRRRSVDEAESSNKRVHG